MTSRFLYAAYAFDSGVCMFRKTMHSAVVLYFLVIRSVLASAMPQAVNDRVKKAQMRQSVESRAT